MKGIIFANPEFFWLLILIPLAILWYILKQKKMYPSLTISSTQPFLKKYTSWKQRFRHFPFILRLLVLALVIIVLARPQSTSSSRSVETEGVDIVIALDISSSMLAEDFKPNRLDAAKKYALEFIDKRIDDRIGLVVFSRESFTQCPITSDHDVLKNLFSSIKSGMIEDGTAIGMGLATSISRLKDSKAKSKVVILLTDGINNAGYIAPMSAADMAKTFNIKVYTIGVGTRGKAPYPFQTPYGIQYQNVDVQIDEDILKNISNTTNGKYFRATGNKSLEKIYDDIDKLEKTRIDEKIFRRYSEEYRPFALAAVIIFIFELFLRIVVFRSIP